MKASQDYMKNHGILPRISFADGRAFTVKILKDKVDSIPDATSPGGRKEGMSYLVEHEGENKSIFTGSVGLISKLAAVEEGSLVTIQMKKANNKSFYVVTGKDGAEVKGEGDEDETIVADDDTVSVDPSW